MRVEWRSGKNLSLFSWDEELIENLIRDGVMMINCNPAQQTIPASKHKMPSGCGRPCFQPLGEIVLMNDRAAGKMWTEKDKTINTALLWSGYIEALKEQILVGY